MPSDTNRPAGSGDGDRTNGHALVDALARLTANPGSADPRSAVDVFAARLLAAGTASRCVGTSCRMHGANGLHRALESALATARPDFVWIDAGCLARCGHGPNLRVDRDIWRGSDQTVETDTRTWVS